MVRAWYHDGSDEKPAESHMLQKGEYLTLEELKDLTGVIYYTFNTDTISENAGYAQLKKDRNYSCEDQIEVSRKTFPNYEEKMKMFYSEHRHDDEEIRLIEDGVGYFDVRSSEDRWIRIEVVKDDLLIVPPGLYHRFTPGVDEYIKARRLFTEVPSWTPIYRE